MSIRWKCLPPWSQCTTLASMVYLCCFSSSSKSQMLVPSSTLALRLMAPVVVRILSTRVVLPADPCPQKATLRICSTGYLGMKRVLIPTNG